jgi:hypothetical protein
LGLYTDLEAHAPVRCGPSDRLRQTKGMNLLALRVVQGPAHVRVHARLQVKDLICLEPHCSMPRFEQ